MSDARKISWQNLKRKTSNYDEVFVHEKFTRIDVPMSNNLELVIEANPAGNSFPI